MSNEKRVKHHTSTVVICCTQTTATGRWMMSLFVAIWQTGIHQLSTMRDMQIMWNFRSAARFMCWERGTKQTNTYDEWHSLLALFALQSAKHTTIHQCKQVLHHHTTTRQQGSSIQRIIWVSAAPRKFMISSRSPLARKSRFGDGKEATAPTRWY